MSNPHRGEVSFEADGVTYQLAFTINAICVLEDTLDMSVTQIGARMKTGMRLSFLRTVFWAGLTGGEGGLSLQTAGVIMTALGAERSGELIAEAFQKAFPQAEKSGSRPRVAPQTAAPDGSGQISSVSGVN